MFETALVLAVQLLAPEVIDAGTAVLGKKFSEAAVKCSAKHLKKYLPEGSLLYSKSDSVNLAIIDFGDGKDHQKTVESILHAIKSPLVILNSEFLPQPKIGYSISSLNKNVKAEDIIREATSALTQILSTKKSIAQYEENEDRFLSKKWQLMTDMRSALNTEEQFFLNFQPIINYQDGRLDEVECLMRWNHPDFGNIPPFLIIPWIEETPLMQDLTIKVINLAVRAAQEIDHINKNLKFAVNVSACDLYFERIYDHLEVAKNNMNSSRLIIELTETAIVEDLATVEKQLSQVKDMGYRVHVDDFGVGQSSLSYLTKLPADAIKLDRSFLRQIDEDSNNIKISSGICELAKQVGFEVVVEGVEFEDDFKHVQTIKPHLLQGYGIAQPMPLSDLKHWLSDYQPSKTA